jgi:hypothetical protein
VKKIDDKFNELHPDLEIQPEEGTMIRDITLYIQCPADTMTEAQLSWIFESLLSLELTRRINTIHDKLHSNIHTETDTNLRMERVLNTLDKASVILTELVDGREGIWTENPDEVFQRLVDSNKFIRKDHDPEKTDYIARVALRSTPAVFDLTNRLVVCYDGLQELHTKPMRKIDWKSFVTRGPLGGLSADRAE